MKSKRRYFSLEQKLKIVKEGLKSSKKETKLSKREEELLNENKRLEELIIQLSKEHVELRKKTFGL